MSLLLLGVVSTVLPVLLGMLGMAVIAWVMIARDKLNAARYAFLATGEAA